MCVCVCNNNIMCSTNLSDHPGTSYLVNSRETDGILIGVKKNRSIYMYIYIYSILARMFYDSVSPWSDVKTTSYPRWKLPLPRVQRTNCRTDRLSRPAAASPWVWRSETAYNDTLRAARVCIVVLNDDMYIIIIRAWVWKIKICYDSIWFHTPNNVYYTATESWVHPHPEPRRRLKYKRGKNL